MAAADEIRRIINLLPATAGAQINSDYAFVRCAWHKNKSERSPSMKVPFSDGKRYKAGFGKCFGCGCYKSISEIAGAWGLAGFDSVDLTQREVVEMPISREVEEEMLGTSKTYGMDMSDMVRWSSKEDWRSISGKLVRKVGGRLFFNDTSHKHQLYLPVFVNDIHIGGVRCNLKKFGKRNYFNTKGSWSGSILYPYDYVKANFTTSTIVLVEGARDALNLIQNDIPAVALLGANNWSKAKQTLVLSTDCERIITALDPDEAGEQGTKKIYAALKDILEVRRFKMVENEDPGNLEPDRIAKLKRFVYR